MSVGFHINFSALKMSPELFAESYVSDSFISYQYINNNSHSLNSDPLMDCTGMRGFKSHARAYRG